jgi:hypothetical protein
LSFLSAVNVLLLFSCWYGGPWVFTRRTCNHQKEPLCFSWDIFFLWNWAEIFATGSQGEWLVIKLTHSCWTRGRQQVKGSDYGRAQRVPSKITIHLHVCIGERKYIMILYALGHPKSLYICIGERKYILILYILIFNHTI